MLLELGNWRAFGDSLAKTSIILSSVPLSRLFWSCPISMWIQWLFLVASAYSLGQWGDSAALGMNIWINSSREETVTAGPYRGTKLTAKFQLFCTGTPTAGVCFDAESFISMNKIRPVVHYKPKNIFAFVLQYKFYPLKSQLLSPVYINYKLTWFSYRDHFLFIYLFFENRMNLKIWSKLFTIALQTDWISWLLFRAFV